MKKILYTALSLLALASIPAQAQVRLYENFNSYADGETTNVTGGLWKAHSANANDTFISGHKLQVFGTRADDVNRSFTGNYTNTGIIYAAFTINMSSLPVNGLGTYFAHFKDSGFNFHGRIYAVTGDQSGVNPDWSVAPGKYRLGVANAAADGSLTSGGLTSGTGPSRVFPMDLATNVDYQVVVEYDPANGAKLWINPAVSTDPSTAFSGDAGAASTNGVSAYAFRQNTGQGQQTVDNLVVGDTFADVVTNIPLAAPVIAVQPVGTTNYAGNPYTLSATVTGPGAISYQWTLGGTNISGATSSAYSIASLGAGDSGTYTVVVSNAFPPAVTSSPAIVSVNLTPTSPFFSVQPTGATNQVSKPFSLSPAVGGTGPLTYQWYQNGNPASGPGANSLVYSITQATTNDSGDYTLVVSGAYTPPATSQVATVLITLPLPTPIGYLRSLENTNTWQPTDTTTLFSITGTVINPTSPTSGNTSSYYVQDATGGINLFISGTSAFRPALGDIVTAVGPLQSFSQNLELALTTLNSFHTFSDTGTNVPLPAPVAFSATSTNNLPYMEALESSYIIMTNVYFKTGGGTNVFKASTTYVITNSVGVPFTASVGTIVSNLNGVSIPTFAWSLTGVLIQNNSSTNLKAGYQIMISQPSDITTNAPSAVSLSAAKIGLNTKISWTAQPYHYAYSVLSATNVAGPYTVLASGLTFTNSVGAYTDASAGVTAKYYRVTSP